MHRLDTNCNTCIFAEKTTNVADSFEYWSTQTGCKLNLLDKYREQGVKVLECYGDGNDEFFVLDKFKCPYHRTVKWKNYAAYLKGDFTVDDIKTELAMDYQVIIILPTEIEEGKYSTYYTEMLGTTLYSVMEQSTKPKLISVIRKNRNIDTKAIQAELEAYKDEVMWRLNNIQDPTKTDEEAVDIALKCKHERFYFVIKSGDTINDPSLFETINNDIIDNSFAFSILKTEYGYLVPYEIHKIFSGNFQYSLEDKLKHEWKDNHGVKEFSNIRIG